MGEKIKPLLVSNGKYADSQGGNNAEVLELLKFYQSLGAQVGLSFPPSLIVIYYCDNP
jgi:hypothetical protein